MLGGKVVKRKKKENRPTPSATFNMFQLIERSPVRIARIFLKANRPTKVKVAASTESTSSLQNSCFGYCPFEWK